MKQKDFKLIFTSALTEKLPLFYINLHTSIYIYIYIYMCVCVCVCAYTYIYIERERVREREVNKDEKTQGLLRMNYL